MGSNDFEKQIAQIAGGAPERITPIRFLDLSLRCIGTGEHCYGCTAGSGSSCGGALV